MRVYRALLVLLPFVTARYSLHLGNCPISCKDASRIDDWTVYHSLDRLAACAQTMLVEFNVFNDLSDPDSHSTIFACTVEVGQNTPLDADTDTANRNFTAIQSRTRQAPNLSTALSMIENEAETASLISAVRALQTHVLASDRRKDTIAFSYAHDTMIGIFARSSGPALDDSLQSFIDHVRKEGLQDSLQMDTCTGMNEVSENHVGIVAATGDSMPIVQKLVRSWITGQCSPDLTSTRVSLDVPGTPPRDMPIVIHPQDDPSWRHTHDRAEPLLRRSDCVTTTVQTGDSCAILAERCKVSAAQFTEYNAEENLCATLQPGQHVCCSSGTLPNFAPKPQADGTCAVHKVVSGDTCSGIAAANSITVDNIGDWNSQTWQFMGCNNIQIGQVICLSKGMPPMPDAIPNAICGPQVPGTLKPANITKEGAMASLNQCPLKACCNIWGQCGITSDFCTESKSAAGAPGTAAPGENGCIQNCGTDIKKSNPPAKPFTIGYFEGYNVDRECLVMDALDIDAKKYTHMHFAFANISSDYKVSLSGSTAAQWNRFKRINGPKRIISFGGWSFSTEVDSYAIFGKAVSEANRQTFIASLTRFVKNEGIDGLDFDWEYPAAPDIPGIPPGDPNDGARYFQFLKDLRAVLPRHISLSIAAPASYWYLKGFPIAEIAEVVDYIVYMTYDLHGQWDYGNAWSQPGCAKGNCLRSQVNLTETNSALSMITKAGVPSNKVVVGITSYGRSFKMEKPRCTGPMCKFVGPESEAHPGECTKQRGYLSNAEINDILKGDKFARTFYDTDSNSDVLVYQSGLQWVSYMTENTKISRSAYYRSLNFLGTVDWAVDLAEFTGNVVSETLPECYDGDKYDTIDEVINDKGIPESCVNTYMLSALSNTMTTTLSNYSEILKHDFASRYNAFKKQIRNQAQEQFAKFEYEDDDFDEYFDCVYRVPDDHKGYTNETGTCPKGWYLRWHGNEYNLTYVAKNHDKFCEKVQNDYGIDCSWVEYSTYDNPPDRYRNTQVSWRKKDQRVVDRPVVPKNFSVPDPSEAITQGLDNYRGLADWLAESSSLSAIHMLPAQEADVIDGASTAIFTTQAAVEAMQQVSRIGKKAKDEEKKKMVLLIVSAVLLVVPALGEAVGALANVALIARLATLFAEAGEASLAIHDIVENPESAPMVIVSSLLGGVGRRDESIWSEAGKIRRSMKPDVIKALGDGVAENMNKLSGAQKACSR